MEKCSLCKEDEHCAANDTCVTSPEEVECESNEDCQEGHKCKIVGASKKCVKLPDKHPCKECKPSQHCDEHHKCKDDTEEPPAPTHGCKVTEDCPEPNICKVEKSIRNCSEPGPYDPCKFCLPKEYCTDKLQCKKPEDKSECGSNEDCMKLYPNRTVCKLTKSLKQCVPPTECNPNCLPKEICTEKKTCEKTGISFRCERLCSVPHIYILIMLCCYEW